MTDPVDSMLSAVVRALPAYADLRAGLSASSPRVVVSGGVGALPGLLLAAIGRDLGRPLAVVVADEKEAERIRGDVEAGGLHRIFHAPSPSLTPYQRIPPSLKAQREEFALLAALRDPESVEAVILPARSLFTRLPTPDEFEKLAAVLREGEEVSLTRFVARLTEVGYRRGDLVIEAGDLAVRGGLFDLFPPDRESPIRVELDGDRVASIRLFDPDTQRSRERLSSIRIVPFAVAAASEADRARMAERLGRLPSEVERQVFAPAVSAMPSGWLDHASLSRALLVLVEPPAVAEEIAAFSERLSTDRDPDRDPFLPDELCLPAERLTRALEEAPLAFDRLGLTSATTTVRLPAEAIAGHAGRTAEAATELARSLEGGEEVFVATLPTGGAEKLKRFALEYGLHVSSERREEALIAVPAEISAGFRLRRAAPFRVRRERDLRRGEESARDSGKAHRSLSLRPARLEAGRRRRASRLWHRALQGIEARAGGRGVPRVHGDRLCRREDPPSARRAPGSRAEVRGSRGNRACPGPPGGQRLGAAQGLRQEGDARHDRRALEALRASKHGLGFRVLQRLSLAERIRRRFRVRRDSGPGAGDRGRQAGHAFREADGPPPVRRRRVRQDGSGDARRVQGGARRQTGRRARPDDHPGRPAFPDFSPPLRGVSGVDRASLPVPIEGRAERHSGKGGRRLGRHPDRDSPDARQGPGLSRPGVADRGRGTTLRRRAEGKTQAMANVHRRAVDVGDAHSAVAAPVPLRAARPVDYRDAAARPSRDRDPGDTAQARGHPRGDRGGNRPRRPGLFRA